MRVTAKGQSVRLLTTIACNDEGWQELVLSGNGMPDASWVPVV
jgi:hypothetical protein